MTDSAFKELGRICVGTTLQEIRAMLDGAIEQNLIDVGWNKFVVYKRRKPHFFVHATGTNPVQSLDNADVDEIAKFMFDHAQKVLSEIAVLFTRQIEGDNFERVMRIHADPKFPELVGKRVNDARVLLMGRGYELVTYKYDSFHSIYSDPSLAVYNKHVYEKPKN